MEKNRIQIRLPAEFSSNLTVDNVPYIVQTETVGTATPVVVTRIYSEGRIVHSKKTGCSHLLGEKDMEERLKAVMEEHHKAAADEFVKERAKTLKSKKEYFEQAVKLLKRGGGRAALELMDEGLRKFPGDPFLLSYYGCLLAVSGGDPKRGVKICSEAIGALERSVPFGIEFFYPFFYLNLGRARLASGDKSGAVKAFQEGLKADAENKDLLWEWKKLGVRRKPPIPFLKRDSLINKYIGLLSSRLKK